MTTVEKVGRRHYLRGAPYAERDRLRGAGCNWDPDQKAWWTGKSDVAEDLLARLQDAAETTIRFTRLDTGEWGIRGKGLTAGAAVTVTRSDGTATAGVVGVVVSTAGDGIVTAGFTPDRASGGTRYRRRSSSGRGGGCHTGGDCSSLCCGGGYCPCRSGGWFRCC